MKLIKRFLSLFVVLLFLCPNSWAMNELVASGTCTQANRRISAVNGGATASGGAFVDFGAADVLTGKLGNLLVVSDSTGHTIQGWIKAAGSAETYFDSIGGLDPTLANGDFSAGDTGWNKGAGWTIGAGSASRTDQSVATLLTCTGDSAFAVKYGLYRRGLTISSITSGGVSYPYYNVTSYETTTGDKVRYVTEDSTIAHGWIAGNYNFAGTITNVFSRRVLTPSATGVTITSTKGGATYNWSGKDSAFNYNDASGYTYRIYKTPNVLILSTTFTAANARNSFDATTAFCEASGLDLSTYAGTDAGSTPYLIELQDASGDVAWGFGGAIGGGEALSAEINSGTLTIKKLYQITATEVDHFGTGLEVNEYFVSAGTETCDANNKVKNVTDCAVTGLHIMSARNGTDRGWKTIGSTFGYNDAMTIRVYYLGS